MKKKNIMCIAVLIVAAIVSVIVVSCKKDKDEVATKATNSEAQALLNRIEAFQTLRDAVNSGAKADGSMTVEEMRQTLDLVSNYEHSEHMTPCVNTVLDTIHIAMPVVDNEGYVSETDVVATYTAFESALERCITMVNDDRDVPSYFSIVMPEVETKDDNDIDFVFVRGTENTQNSPLDNGPFPDNVDWHWGKGLGLCKPDLFNVAEGDATTQLSPYFAFHPEPQYQGQTYFLTNVIHTIYKPCNYEIPNITSIYYEDTLMDCADSWLFYTVTSPNHEPCLFGWELNCYYESIVRNISTPGAPLYYAPTSTIVAPAYHSCTIEWQEFLVNDLNGFYCKTHLAHVIYAYVVWSDNPGNNDE